MANEKEIVPVSEKNVEYDELEHELNEKWKIPAFPEVIQLKLSRDVPDEWKNCVIGKKFAPRHVENTSIQKELQGSWKAEKRVQVDVLDTGYFKIKFECVRDLRFVLRNGPWQDEGYVFSPKPWKSNTPLEDYPFCWVPMWIQVFGLPVERKGDVDLNAIAAAFGGERIEVDTVGGKDKKWGSYARVHVLYHVKRPLIKNVVVEIGDKKFRIRFKYERLPLFCYYCGLIGHNFKICPAYLNHPIVIQSEGQTPVKDILRFSGELRSKETKMGVGIIAKSSFNLDPEVEQEERMETENRDEVGINLNPMNHGSVAPIMESDIVQVAANNVEEGNTGVVSNGGNIGNEVALTESITKVAVEGGNRDKTSCIKALFQGESGAGVENFKENLNECTMTEDRVSGKNVSNPLKPSEILPKPKPIENLVQSKPKDVTVEPSFMTKPANLIRSPTQSFDFNKTSDPLISIPGLAPFRPNTSPSPTARIGKKLSEVLSLNKKSMKSHESVKGFPTPMKGGLKRRTPSESISLSRSSENTSVRKRLRVDGGINFDKGEGSCKRKEVKFDFGKKIAKPIVPKIIKLNEKAGKGIVFRENGDAAKQIQGVDQFGNKLSNGLAHVSTHLMGNEEYSQIQKFSFESLSDERTQVQEQSNEQGVQFENFLQIHYPAEWANRGQRMGGDEAQESSQASNNAGFAEVVPEQPPQYP